MWLAGLAMAGEPTPERVLLVEAITEASKRATLEMRSCTVPGKPSRYLVLQYVDPPTGTWTCTDPGEGFECGPSPSPACRDLVRSPLRRGAPPPHISVEGVSRLLASPYAVLVQPGRLIWGEEGTNWWFAANTPQGFVWSGPVAPPLREPTERADVPRELAPLDLTPLFGREAWGIVSAASRAPGTVYQPSDSSYTLLALVQSGEGLVEAGRVALGSERYGRSGAEEGAEWFEQRELRCPVVRGRELLLYRSCSPAAAPRRPIGESADYQDFCDPLCYSGRGAVQRWAVEGDKLVERTQGP